MGAEEDGGWDRDDAADDDKDDDEDEEEEEEGEEEEEDGEEDVEEEEAPAKESSLVLAALKAVATFPRAAGVEDHECVACFCHPQEEGWGARTWLALPCSKRAGNGSNGVAHVMCSSCCESNAKNGRVTCPHCRASYLPPIYQGCRVRTYCPAPVTSPRNALRLHPPHGLCSVLFVTRKPRMV